MKIRETNFTAITLKIEEQIKDAETINNRAFFHRMKKVHDTILNFLKRIQNHKDPDIRAFYDLESLNTLMDEMQDDSSLDLKDLALYIICYYQIEGPKI